MDQLTYSKFFKSMSCKSLVIFEDDFSCEIQDFNNSFLFNIIRMDHNDRTEFLTSIRKDNPDLSELLNNLCIKTDLYFSNIEDWNNIVRNDIQNVLSEINPSDEDYSTLIGYYNKINEFELESIKDIANTYGLGITYPTDYEMLFDEYIWASPTYPSIRIFKDFSTDEKTAFESIISNLEEESSVVCIIDNNLQGEDKAKLIIECIKTQNKDEQKNIIGAVYSSKEKYEETAEHIYIEFVPKSASLDLKRSLARSCYSYFIQRLKENTVSKINNAFVTMRKNKYLASYLAAKADNEGVSEYSIINEWLNLLCKPTAESYETILKLIKSARVINALDEDKEDYYDDSLIKYTTYETFDYSINHFLLPPAAGDIYLDTKNEQYYVLVGQDCDMAWRGNGKEPRNTMYELLPITLYEQTNYNKWINDQKKVCIYNFKKDYTADQNYICSIKYQERKFISKEILSLCSFNSDGKCTIMYKENLNEYQTDILPQYMVSYYSRLQKYFSSLLNIHSKMKEDFCTITDFNSTMQIITCLNMEIEDEKIIYPLVRICRITHEYVYYLYRLFLEYRGRQPFQTINLVGQRKLMLPVLLNSVSTDESIPILVVELPAESNIVKMPWIIEKENFTKIFQEKNIDASSLDEEIKLVTEESTFIVKNSVNGKKKTLKIKKSKDKLNLSFS